MGVIEPKRRRAILVLSAASLLTAIAIAAGLVWGQDETELGEPPGKPGSRGGLPKASDRSDERSERATADWRFERFGRYSVGCGPTRSQVDRRPDAPIPRLKGMTPREVCETLDPLNVEAEFVGACQHSRPVGRVYIQIPSKGSRFLGLGRVRLWTDKTGLCSDETTEETCTELSLDTHVGRITEVAGVEERGLGFWVTNTSEEVCQLRATARLRLRGPGVIPGVVQGYPRGNPARTAIDYRLEPHQRVGGGVGWDNWCRGHRGVDQPTFDRPSKRRWSFIVTVGDLRARAYTPAPICVDPRQPSDLT
jgi:hypothetical protein